MCKFVLYKHGASTLRRRNFLARKNS